MCYQKEKEIAFTQKKEKIALGPKNLHTALLRLSLLYFLDCNCKPSVPFPVFTLILLMVQLYLHVSLLTLVRPISPPDDEDGVACSTTEATRGGEET